MTFAHPAILLLLWLAPFPPAFALYLRRKRLKRAALISHVGGLNAVVKTTLNLPNIRAGKMLIYTHIDMPLTAIDDFAALGAADPIFAKLAEICKKNNGLWCADAEKVLLSAKGVEVE